MDINAVLQLTTIPPDSLKKTKATQDSTKLKECCLGTSYWPSTPEGDAEVSQWITAAITTAYTAPTAFIESVNNWCINKSYMASNKLSIADIVVLQVISSNSTLIDPKKHINILRWMNHISILIDFKTITIPSSSESSSSSFMTLPIFKTAPVVATPISISSGSDDKKGKESKSDGKAKESSKPTEAASSLDPSKLELKVGLVVKCFNHPESEKLLCEEIDVGEEKQRLILSGIRGHYSAEEVQGRLVIVVTNLKERNMGGMRSQGMVMCACTADHSSVKLLEPPTSSKPGELVKFPGFDGTAVTPAQVQKKKILEELLPGMCTDGEGIAGWTGTPMTLSGGVVKAPLKSVPVS